MGKLNNYEKTLNHVKSRLKDLKLYNNHLLDGYRRQNPGLNLKCTMSQSDVDFPLDTPLHLLKVETARNYVKWTTEDHIQGCLKLIEDTFKAERKRKIDKTESPKRISKSKSIRLKFDEETDNYTPEF